MTHTEWRTLGIAFPVFINTGANDQNYYNALGTDWIILRTLVSVMITERVIEQPLETCQPIPIICQVSNFDGAEGDPPPGIEGDPHPLATFMPTLYPGPVVGLGDVLLPVSTRLWTGGTGGQPISVAGRRRTDGSFGGRHIALQSAWAQNSPPDLQVQCGDYTIVWKVSILVQRPD